MNRRFRAGDVGGFEAAAFRRMGVQAYTIAVAFMAGLGGLAALGAVILAVHSFGRRRPVRSPVFVFDPPAAAPVLLRELPPQEASPLHAEPGLTAPPAPEPEPEPELQTLFAPKPEPGPEPVAEVVAGPAPEALAELAPEPDPPPPAPALQPRLELALMSPRAPGRLKVPVDLARGRILELSLPLWISTAGGCDLEDVKIKVVVPNEITYGASLERITREPPGGLPGARTSYVVAEHHTVIEIDIDRLAGGSEANIPVPITIKHAAVGAYQIRAIASAPALDSIERRYTIELIDPAAPRGRQDGAPNWICHPDEAARVRDPHLPLDRIISTNFVITEPGDEEAEAAPESV